MFHTVLTNFIIGNASCFFFTSHTFLSEKQQSFESIRAKPSSPKQNDENDARKREDFETTRLTFFPSSTFETLCMLYFSQFLQSCSYKPSNIHGRRKVHERILVILPAQQGPNGQFSCLHSFKIF